ncbi:MAG: hypothetical protein MdMp014T_1783 [Treponematales bacterium]
MMKKTLVIVLFAAAAALYGQEWSGVQTLNEKVDFLLKKVENFEESIKTLNVLNIINEVVAAEAAVKGIQGDFQDSKAWAAEKVDALLKKVERLEESARALEALNIVNEVLATESAVKRLEADFAETKSWIAEYLAGNGVNVAPDGGDGKTDALLKEVKSLEEYVKVLELNVAGKVGSIESSVERMETIFANAKSWIAEYITSNGVNVAPDSGNAKIDAILKKVEYLEESFKALDRLNIFSKIGATGSSVKRLETDLADAKSWVAAYLASSGITVTPESRVDGFIDREPSLPGNDDIYYTLLVYRRTLSNERFATNGDVAKIFHNDGFVTEDSPGTGYAIFTYKSRGADERVIAPKTAKLVYACVTNRRDTLNREIDSGGFKTLVTNRQITSWVKASF